MTAEMKADKMAASSAVQLVEMLAVSKVVMTVLRKAVL